MSRYIDAEKAIEALAKYEMWSAEVDYPYCSHDLEDYKELPRKHLESVPSIEIVRCKDCKHWEYDVIFQDGWCRGKHQGNPDWFCADGERRTE